MRSSNSNASVMVDTRYCSLSVYASASVESAMDAMTSDIALFFSSFMGIT